MLLVGDGVGVRLRPNESSRRRIGGDASIALSASVTSVRASYALRPTQRRARAVTVSMCARPAKPVAPGGPPPIRSKSSSNDGADVRVDVAKTDERKRSSSVVGSRFNSRERRSDVRAGTDDDRVSAQSRSSVCVWSCCAPGRSGERGELGLSERYVAELSGLDNAGCSDSDAAVLSAVPSAATMRGRAHAEGVLRTCALA